MTIGLSHNMQFRLSTCSFFSVCEWNQSFDLGTVLSPFAEATDLIEGEKMVTITMLVTTVLDLNTNLLQIVELRSQCQLLVTTLCHSKRICKDRL